MMISRYISYNEATVSQTAVRKKIENKPSLEQLEQMETVAERVFDVVREHFGVPIRVSSFFRCEALNKAVGGAKNSQHVKGQAIDMQGTGTLSNSAIFKYIKDNMDFDQLIWEFGNDKNPAWVHVSYNKSHNRKQILYVK